MDKISFEHLVAYVVPALLWIPAYFSSKAASAYLSSWTWAAAIGGAVGLFVFTTLIVSGIEWKDNKEIWITLLIYSVA